jgi:hypothetical protein
MILGKLTGTYLQVTPRRATQQQTVIHNLKSSETLEATLKLYAPEG